MSYIGVRIHTAPPTNRFDQIFGKTIETDILIANAFATTANGIDMLNNVITNSGAPTDDSDLTTKIYVDSQIGNTVPDDIELGTDDPFDRYQVWNRGSNDADPDNSGGTYGGTGSILRFGSLGANGDAQNIISEGAVFYGMNSSGDPMDLNHFAFARIKPTRFQLLDELGAGQYSIFRVDENNLSYRPPTAAGNVFNVNDTQSDFTIPIDMNTNKIIDLGDPTNAQDASTKAYVDGRTLEDVRAVDNQVAGDIDMNNNTLINLIDPTNAQDASTKAYVDGRTLEDVRAVDNQVAGDIDMNDNDLLNVALLDTNQILIKETGSVATIPNDVQFMISNNEGAVNLLIQADRNNGIDEASPSIFLSRDGGIGYTVIRNNSDLMVNRTEILDLNTGAINTKTIYFGVATNTAIIDDLPNIGATTDLLSLNSDESNFFTVLSMNTNKIIDLGDPTNAQDASTKAYVDGRTLEDVRAVDNQVAGDIDMNNNTLINLIDPTNAQDASTKAYVDGRTLEDVRAVDNQVAGDIDMGNNTLINLIDPTNAQDASTKAYVDGRTLEDVRAVDNQVAGDIDMGNNDIFDCQQLRNVSTSVEASVDFAKPSLVSQSSTKQSILLRGDTDSSMVMTTNNDEQIYALEAKNNILLITAASSLNPEIKFHIIEALQTSNLPDMPDYNGITNDILTLKKDSLEATGNLFMSVNDVDDINNIGHAYGNYIEFKETVANVIGSGTNFFISDPPIETNESGLISSVGSFTLDEFEFNKVGRGVFTVNFGIHLTASSATTGYVNIFIRRDGTTDVLSASHMPFDQEDVDTSLTTYIDDAPNQKLNFYITNSTDNDISALATIRIARIN